MKRVPEANVLLRATADYLEAELLPTLEGYHRFQTRVAVRLLRMLEREIELAPGQAAGEHARLQALLGREGGHEALDLALVEAIETAAIALDDRRLVDHLRRSLADALAIDSPGWAEDEPGRGGSRSQ